MSLPFFESRGWEVDGTYSGAWKLDRLQLALGLLSAVAILLISELGPIARWGFVVGLISQPLWILATWRARQAGMFAISVLYLAIWIRGIVNHFPELFAWI